MTDFEKFTNLMDSFGIPYEVEVANAYFVRDVVVQDSGAKSVVFKVKKDVDNVNGYTDFEAEFLFDSRGNSVGMAVWE